MPLGSSLFYYFPKPPYKLRILLIVDDTLDTEHLKRRMPGKVDSELRYSRLALQTTDAPNFVHYEVSKKLVEIPSAKFDVFRCLHVDECAINKQIRIGPTDETAS